LDGCGGGKFFDSLSIEIDDLVIQGGEVLEQVFVAVQWKPVGGAFGGVFGYGMR
jgi:hypothetical protein